MKRAAKYKRISRDREGRELGIERQDEDLEQLAKYRGLTVVADYTDNDISASTRSAKPRPGYRQMLTDAHDGRFDVIIAYTTGRLTRRPREFEDLIDLSRDYGIEFEYVRSPSFDLNSAQGRRIARTLAAQDAGEAEDISERVQRQKEQAAASGQWRGGRRPYGFLADGVTVNAAEAADIVRCTEQVLLGASLSGLARDLNERGRVTSTGRPWSSSEVRRLLRRARNAGLVEAHQAGALVVVAQAQWPAIVTEAQWRAVVAVLDDPGRRTNRSNIAKRWLGSGLYRCAVCGGLVRATLATVRTGGGHHMYRCQERRPAERAHVARRAEYVDEIVEAAILRWLSQPFAAARLRGAPSVDVPQLQSELVVLRRRLDEADEMFAAGEINRRSRANITTTVRQDIERVEGKLALAASASPATGILTAPDIAAAWRELDIARRQAVVDEIAEVFLHPGSRGRRPGWRPGQRYFDERTVEVRWRRPSD